MKKTRTKILAVVVLVLLAGLYYYIKLPAINIHAAGFWTFLLVLIAAVAVFYIGRRRMFRKEEIKQSGIAKGLIGLFLVVCVIYLGGTLFVISDHQCQEIPEAVDSGKRRFPDRYQRTVL